MPVADAVSKGDVIAFRLNAHHLAERLGEGELLEAAGRCGVQNSPPGSALLAMHARVRDLTQEQVAEAVAEEKSLLQTWCMRGSPFYFPTVDAPVFTTGVLPPTEEAMRHFILGVEPALDKLDMSLIEAVELTGAEIRDVLSGRQLAINELGAEIAQRIARKLPKKQRDIWEEEGPYAPDQPLGEGVVHFCIRILTLAAGGLLRAARREQGTVRPGRRVAWPSDPGHRPGGRARRTASPLPALLRTVDARGTSPPGRGSMPVTPTPGGAWSRTS